MEHKFQLHTKLNRKEEKQANTCDIKDWSIVMKVRKETKKMKEREKRTKGWEEKREGRAAATEW